MDVLKKTNDYETLMDLALQLQRNPEADKKYLNDTDKKELFHQAVTCCVQAFKNKLREITTENGDEKNRELLSLMLNIFKSHRKTLKIFQQKDQTLFSGVLVEAYKEYIKEFTITMPDSANLTDLAFKMCQQELNYRKNLEKGIVTTNPNPPMNLQQHQQQQQQASSSATSSPILVKSVSEINKTVISTASGQNVQNSTSNQTTSATAKSSQSTAAAGSSARTKPRGSSKNPASSSAMSNSALNSMLMSIYTNPNLLTQMMPTDSSNFMNEFYKSLLTGTTAASSSASSINSLSTQQQLALLNDPMSAMMYSPLTGQSPSSSPKASSSYEKKYLESLKNMAYGSSNAHSLMGLKQNLMSNSLSITTTTMTSTTSSASASKSLAGKSQSSVSKKVSKEPTSSISISKSQDGGISGKYSSLFASNLNLPDLPKSLSITPSMPSTSSKTTRVSDKSKLSKQKSNFNRAAVSITPDSFSLASASNMQASYQDFLKNYTAQQQQSMAAAMPTKTKSSPINVSSSSSLLKPHKHKSVSQLPGSSQPKKSFSSKSAQLSYDFGKNIASSLSGIPLTPPTLSKSPFTHHTPPLVHSPSLSTVSPTKTLQQKLAERKQQNQPQKKKPGKLH